MINQNWVLPLERYEENGIEMYKGVPKIVYNVFI